MTVWAAVAAQMRALLDDDPGLAAVAPADHALAEVAAAAAGRVVSAPATVRAAVAAGLCTTGRAVVSLWGPGEDARVLGGGAQVGIVADAVLATALWATGVPVVHPCWTADVGRLLRTALAVGEPIALHAPDTPGGETEVPTDAPLPPLEGGQLRWLRGRSELGAVLACGAPAARALAAATALAGQGLHLGVIEAPWQPGGAGRTPFDAATSVILLPPSAVSALERGRLAPEHAIGAIVADGDVDHLASALVRALDVRARGTH
jgi:hypothetical protein